MNEHKINKLRSHLGAEVKFCFYTEDQSQCLLPDAGSGWNPLPYSCQPIPKLWIYELQKVNIEIIGLDFQFEFFEMMDLCESHKLAFRYGIDYGEHVGMPPVILLKREHGCDVAVLDRV